MTCRSTAYFAAAVSMICTSLAIAGQVLYVDDDAPAGGSGLSWDAPYQRLQDALAAARKPASGVIEIRIGGGTYRPDQGASQLPGDQDESFLLADGVAIRGGYAGYGASEPDLRDLSSFETVLSGDLLENDGPEFEGYDDNSLHVVTGESPSRGTALDGLTIRSGNAMGWAREGDGGGLYVSGGTLEVVDCTFTRNRVAFDGAGAFLTGSEAVIERSFFLLNSGFNGGGLYLDGGTASVSDTIFFDNYTWEDGGALNASGDQMLLRCTFVENSGDDGGAAELFGTTTCIQCVFEDNGSYSSGAVFVPGQATFFDCDFIRSSTGLGGGAVTGNATFVGCHFIDCLGGGGGAVSSWSGLIVDCVFMGNATIATGPGGALVVSSGLVVNSLFVANRAGSDGGAVRASDGAELINCTFTRNTALDGSGAAVFGEAHLRNCIVWDNIPDQLDLGPLSTVEYSCVEGGWAGEGNIETDPLFEDPVGPDGTAGTMDDDLRLGEGSPCIDAADNAAVPPDVMDVDGDGDTEEKIPTDLDGESRFVNDPDTPDTGNPAGMYPIVDMGPYEFAPGPPGDIDGDGDVDFTDLLLLLSEWGPCFGCPEDLNGDGAVSFVDLLILLEGWG